jgi:hypothetical protein
MQFVRLVSLFSDQFQCIALIPNVVKEEDRKSLESRFVIVTNPFFTLCDHFDDLNRECLTRRANFINLAL